VEKKLDVLETCQRDNKVFSKRPDISYQKKNKINKQINKFSKNIQQTTNFNNTIFNRAIH
jgi:hypothetical protein